MGAASRASRMETVVVVTQVEMDDEEEERVGYGG